jgi:hypothetical protein
MTHSPSLLIKKDDYRSFLQSKRCVSHTEGLEVAPSDLPPHLFPFQKDIVQWALRKGRAAIWADCGLGKSFMQCSWSNIVHKHTKEDILILAPLAVTAQTIAEGAKLGIPVHPCRKQSDVRSGINITNYEMLEHFDPSRFVGVVLDESSLLKSYMGRTKRALVEGFAPTPYRLACTATPAPNDVMEIGNHSEFLGVMPSNEMMMRWFINDTMKSGHYRLKGHAIKDFWEWVASWAVSVRKPSDLGYSDEGYVLPELVVKHHYVETDVTVGAEDGQLFRAPTMSATTLHREMRLTAADRAQAVADLVNTSSEVWICWCNTNYEADELKARIPDAVEVRGSDTLSEKERKINAFSQSLTRVIIGKPSQLGFGLNWQHCHNAAFVGLSYSMEQFYQAVRRIYRFGQKCPVNIHIIAAETESPLVVTLERKLHSHLQMSEAMNNATSPLTVQEDLALTKYNPPIPMLLPDWLSAPQEGQGAA